MAEHGSLRRATDRLRTAVGWTVVVCAVAVVAWAVVAAVAAYHAGLDRIRHDAATRSLVVGTLLDDAEPAGTGPAQPVRIQYVDPQGRERLGRLPVFGPLHAGTAVRVEVDGDGAVGVAAPTRSDALFSAVCAAVAVALLGAFLLGMTWLGAGRLVTARNHLAWEREWRLVEPRWSGRTAL